MSIYDNPIHLKDQYDELEPDFVNDPPHYKTGKVKCIDCIESVVKMYEGDLAYNVGTVVKYLYRAPTKNNFIQDLEKAQWYLNRVVKMAKKLYK